MAHRTAPRLEAVTTLEAFVLLEMLARGRHLSVLPDFPLRRLSRRFGLVSLPWPGPPAARPIYLWNRTTTTESGLMAEVGELILSQVRAMA